MRINTVKVKGWEFAVCFATKPDDYIRMFDVQCGSCMVLGAGGYEAGQTLWQEMITKYKIHPASWYFYTPHSKGVWIEWDGTPIARCMLYRANMQDENWAWFSDIKAVSFDAKKLLFGIMKAYGKTYLEEGKIRLSTPQDFIVPGYNTVSKHGVVCPLPHCDMQAKDFSVTYDSASKSFTFWPDKDAPPKAYKVTSTYNHDGYLEALTVLRGNDRKIQGKLDLVTANGILLK